MLEINNHSDPLLVTLRGVLDESMQHDFNERLQPLFELRGRRLVIDLAGCKRITSAGISLLVTLVVRANLKGGRIVIARPSSFVKTIFEMAKLDQYFEVRDTIAEAVALCGSSHDGITPTTSAP